MYLCALPTDVTLVVPFFRQDMLTIVQIFPESFLGMPVMLLVITPEHTSLGSEPLTCIPLADLHLEVLV